MSAAKIGTALFLAMATLTATAAAEETAPVKKNGVYYFDDIVIPGRPQRPMVAVDIGRAIARTPLPDLRKPLVDYLGRAVEKDPF
jgi:hypothetical protein